MLYLHSEAGLSLAIYRTAIHCYAWILFQAGSPTFILDFDQTTGRHGFDQAVREGLEALSDYRTGALPCSR